MDSPKISVVIPTLNEGGHIEELLQHLHGPDFDFFEIIVCDAGSTDYTREVCEKFPCLFLCSDRKGRAFQMNYGARRARGDVLLFLHADTRLPLGADQAIRKAMTDSDNIAGGFSKVFDHSHFLLRGGVAKCRLRVTLLGTIAGDQGLFVRAKTFWETGGYPPVRIMEEFILCNRLRDYGNIVLLADCVKTSARRFLKKGVFRCYFRMTLVSFLYYLRFPTPILEKVYYSD